MSEFYAKSDDEYRCRAALIRKETITVDGLTTEGRAGTFTGRVQAVEAGHRLISGYPLRIRILDSSPPQPRQDAG